MREILTAAQMRAVEQAAIESGDVTGLELMERAGAGVVEAALACWPDLAAQPGRAVIACGPGNNGGDGFVVARLLRARGWEVEVWLAGAPDRLPPDARANYARWQGEVQPLGAPPELQRADLVVDALFGTGLSRPVTAPALVAWLAAMAAATAARGRAKTVAVDIPSGLCADSGRVLGAVAEGLLTVSFHRAKCGHYLGQGRRARGRLVVCDIGLEGVAAPGPVAELVEPPSAAALAKAEQAHKYNHGHGLILAGASGRGGAARLAARAALRIGAGAVSLGVPRGALVENAAQINAIMLAEIDDAGALEAVLGDPRITALCLGPGLGLARARALVPVALAAGRGCVLDADALTAYAQNPEALVGMTHADTVLTPHAGEFARIFPDLAARLAAPVETGPACSGLDAARAAAARAGCVVVLKGPDTVIAAPDGRALVHARPAPWLATAGAGDVLAGFIAGLLARGWPPLRAAAAGVWLHAECARRFGPGLIAEDLPEQLPLVLRELE